MIAITKCMYYIKYTIYPLRYFSQQLSPVVDAFCLPCNKPSAYVSVRHRYEETHQLKLVKLDYVELIHTISVMLHNDLSDIRITQGGFIINRVIDHRSGCVNLQ